MPDSIHAAGDPGVSRDSKRRTGAPASAARRAPSSGYGAVAQAQYGGMRWRDIEWVDFTSEPDSGMAPRPEPAPPAPAPPPPTAQPSPKGAPPNPTAFGNVVRRLGAATKTDDNAVIPGLKPRFTRLPVTRPALAPMRSTRPDTSSASEARAAAPKRLPPPPLLPPRPAAAPAMPKTGSVVVYPRAPSSAEAVVPEARSVALRLPEAPPGRALGGPTEDPFPASIATPVTASPPASGTAPPRWRSAIGDRAAIAGSALRGAAAAAAGGLTRARERWRDRPPAEPEPTLASPLTAAVDAVSRYVAARENRLRVSGIAALVTVLIAVAAYIGGAVLARALGPSAGAASSGATTAVNKQLAIADKVARPQVAAVPKPPPAPNAPPSDPVARAEFYMARAKAGDAAAQYDVAVLYARGDGLVQDMASAATWFHAAAAQGNVSAEYNLGVMYERGLGVAVDPTAALNWYRSAADQNHPAAQFNLALAYANGAGTKQDFAAAARWYRRAAEQGLLPAMVNLAILCEGGKGVERSPAEAYAWYSAAGERGDAGAKTRAGELFQRFNEKDKAQAQGIAATIGATLDQAQAKPPA